MKKILKALFAAFLIVSSLPVFAKDGDIVDWCDKNLGEDSIPSWLRDLRRGNCGAYIDAYGLDAGKKGRKWITPACGESEISWEDGLIQAQAASFSAFGNCIATDVNSSLSSEVSNGAKNNIKKTVLNSVTTVTGMEDEGYFWQKVEKVSTVGKRKRTYYVYYVYQFYSMDMQTYDTQMKNALIQVLKKGGLPQDQAQAVATASFQVVESEKRESAKHEKAVAEEQLRQLRNHKQSIENRKMSMDEKKQDQQYDIDNRNIDTQQLKITETTKMTEDRNKTDLEKTRAATNANDKAAMNAAAATPEASDGDSDISDALAFLYSL